MKYKVPHKLLDAIMEEARATNVSPIVLIEQALTEKFVNKESKSDQRAATQPKP